MIVSVEQVNQCEHSYLPEESSHEYLIASCSVAPTHLAEITTAVVMVNERDDHENVIDCWIVDDDDDRRRCQMMLTESVDENVDVSESGTGIVIVIEIVIDDDVSVKVIVNTDAMMTSMTMMMMMMMTVVMARRMPAAALPSRLHVTRGCRCIECEPTRQR